MTPLLPKLAQTELMMMMMVAGLNYDDATIIDRKCIQYFTLQETFMTASSSTSLAQIMRNQVPKAS